MKNVILCLSLGFLLLTGCSRFDIAFNWADTYFASKVDDYFDISSKQSKTLKSDIKNELHGIRTEVVPMWSQRLKEIQKEFIAGTLNEDQVTNYFSAFLKDFEQINSRFADTAADFIATTSPEQINHFEKFFRKKNGEDLEKFKNTKKFKSYYLEKYTDWFEKFIGTLTSEQKKMLTDHLDATPFPAELKVRNKEYVFQKFLQEQNSTEQMKSFVKSYYANPEIYDLPEYREALAQYHKGLQRFLTQILAVLTQEQKNKFSEALNDKISQLDKIANQR